MYSSSYSPLCPACLKNTTQVLWCDNFDSKEYCLIKCFSCGLHFVSPIPEAHVLSLLYYEDYSCYHNNRDVERAYPTLKVRVAHWRFARGSRKLFKSLLKKFLSVCVEIALGRYVSFSLGVPLSLSLDAKILDVGCGTGNWLILMQQQGYKNLMGCDISGPAYNRLQPLGIPVVVGTLPELGLPAATFDLIRMEHVLEHVLNPSEYLNEMARLLKPDGSLVVVVPAIESLSYKVSGKNWAALDFPRHLYHYSLESLRLLASRSGLAVRRYRYLPVWPVMAASVALSVERLFGKRLSKCFRSGITSFIASPLYGILSGISQRGDSLTVEFVHQDMVRRKK